MNPLFHTDLSISDSLKSVRKSVLIYETIILSDELWNYYVSMEEIRTMVQNAYALAVTGNHILYDENTYQGKAYDEMFFFMASLVGHVEKLMMLYSAAETYLINTLQAKCEEELLEWTISHLGE